MSIIPGASASGLDWAQFTSVEWKAFTSDEWGGFEAIEASTAGYDAWNRLVKAVDGGITIKYSYDGLGRLVLRSVDEGGFQSVRHVYFTQSTTWQVLEERREESSPPQLQYIWGLRYIDELITRERIGVASRERQYAIQDASWNVVAVVGVDGQTLERMVYSGYGIPRWLSPGYIELSYSEIDWLMLYRARDFEYAIGVYSGRYRGYSPRFERWLQRDALGYVDGMNLYAATFVPNNVDPSGGKCIVSTHCYQVVPGGITVE
ncbi:hypothetical protein [Rubinisphaera margarita]|uniref:hypothetical protein n=1 Tax=Rubinisphaera margarita TaxID=2909586 RepID=UPI001EE8906B|nr:hypothetical protein [Rubinisphaera margarita]MCG6154175.1 hypothetical protein [Rubinisphaera margarita]